MWKSIAGRLQITKLSFQIATSDILELTNHLFSMPSGCEFCKTEELFQQYEILIKDASTLMVCLLILIYDISVNFNP